MAGQDALVVPTIFDADRKSLGEIARESRALAEKVRDGKITPPELSGGTFTVSNLGMYGIDRITPVINPPQAAILGVGAMNPQPAVVDGEVTVRTRMTLTLVCDHRILYGADAAEFLAPHPRAARAPAQPRALAARVLGRASIGSSGRVGAVERGVGGGAVAASSRRRGGTSASTAAGSMSP